MNEFNETKTLPVTIDEYGVVADINPYSFTTVVSGTLVGAFLGYWQPVKCSELAQQIDNVINDKGCSKFWLRTVSDIIQVAKVVEQHVADPEFMTEKVFLEWIRDGLNKKF